MTDPPGSRTRSGALPCRQRPGLGHHRIQSGTTRGEHPIDRVGFGPGFGGGHGTVPHLGLQRPHRSSSLPLATAIQHVGGLTQARTHPPSQHRIGELTTLVRPSQPLHRGGHLGQHPIQQLVHPVQEPVARHHRQHEGVGFHRRRSQPVHPPSHHNPDVGGTVHEVQRGEDHLGRPQLHVRAEVAVAAHRLPVVGQLHVGSGMGEGCCQVVVGYL
jgi:hypothetical protein